MSTVIGGAKRSARLYCHLQAPNCINHIVVVSKYICQMDNSMEDNSPYPDDGINNYSVLKSQDRYLMNSNSNSAFSTSPSSRNSFEIVGGNQRQTISAQVN